MLTGPFFVVVDGGRVVIISDVIVGTSSAVVSTLVYSVVCSYVMLVASGQRKENKLHCFSLL